MSQDVFTEAFRLHKAGPVQSWTGLLVRLATLRSLDRLRRNRPSVELRECDGMSTAEPFEELAAGELALWLRQAIAQLPDQQATVFVMHYFEQLSREQFPQPWASPRKPSRRRCTRPSTFADTVGRLPARRFQMNDELAPRFRGPRTASGSRSQGGPCGTDPGRCDRTGQSAGQAVGDNRRFAVPCVRLPHSRFGSLFGPSSQGESS